VEEISGVMAEAGFEREAVCVPVGRWYFNYAGVQRNGGR